MEKGKWIWQEQQPKIEEIVGDEEPNNWTTEQPSHLKRTR
jgi:hypothetical protein